MTLETANLVNGEVSPKIQVVQGAISNLAGFGNNRSGPAPIGGLKLYIFQVSHWQAISPGSPNSGGPGFAIPTPFSNGIHSIFIDQGSNANVGGSNPGIELIGIDINFGVLSGNQATWNLDVWTANGGPADINILVFGW